MAARGSLWWEGEGRGSELMNVLNKECSLPANDLMASWCLCIRCASHTRAAVACKKTQTAKNTCSVYWFDLLVTEHECVCVLCVVFSLEEDVENFEMASLPLDTQRNIEADSFWCMSKLLDGIQVFHPLEV